MPAYSILLYLHCQIQNMNEMKNDLSGITVFVSILSLIISCIALFNVFPTTGRLSFDYQGILVGILSLLVTVLIGLQIYNYISFERRMEKIAFDISDRHGKEAYLHIIKDVYTTIYAESLRLISGNIYYGEWYKTVVMHRQLLSIARVIGNEEYYKQQFHRAATLSENADKFDSITMKEFKEYILELRSLSATTDLGTDICLELEKKYL